MKILYIDEEHCSSVEQLKGFFLSKPKPNTNLYADLLEYGRLGYIADWLRDMNEPALANKVDAINKNIPDSAFFVNLSAVITGTHLNNAKYLKPAFDRCFAVESVSCDIVDDEAFVTVRLKVLECVNELFELSVSCNWDSKSVAVNPYHYMEDKSVSIDVVFHKQSGMPFGKLSVLADGVALSIRNLLFSDELREFVVDGVAFNMVHVAKGTFFMGDDNASQGDVVPCHQVTLDSYSIGETLVTQALWKAVMDSNPSSTCGDNLPVTDVSWIDCYDFISKLNEKTGMQFRLPTEAEWEFAARGGSKSKHTLFAGSNNIDSVAWCRENSNNAVHPVMTKNANELGVYDMVGNVEEWCYDWYSLYSNVPQINPVCSLNDYKFSGRVARGGSFASMGNVFKRCCIVPTTRCSSIGFRLAL